EIAEFAGSAIMAEDIGDCESEINPAQETNITNVLNSALADHRHNSQLVSIIEDRGEIITVCREDEARISGHERERVGVHALGNRPQVGARCEADAAALGARGRLLLGLRRSIEDQAANGDETANHHCNKASYCRSQSQALAHDRAPFFEWLFTLKRDLPLA